MMVPAFIVACLALASQASKISFRASPRMAVETVTDDVTLDCKIPSAVTDVEMALLVMVKQTTSDEEGELLTVRQIPGKLEMTEGNRTEATANLKSSDGGDPSTFLSVKILDPIESDSGTYECNIVYLDTNNDVQNFVSSVDINVTAVPPPNYVPQPSDSCECEEIWEEIDNIKATLSSRPTAVGGSVAPAGACQVSFSAQFESRHGYSLTDGQTALFNSATSNRGDAYDVTSGEFTAPCDGQYFFTVVMRSSQDLDAGYVDGVLMVDDVAVARTSVFTDDTLLNMEQAATGKVVTLTQGQKVKVVVRTTSSGEIIGNEYSVFSGFYLSP